MSSLTQACTERSGKTTERGSEADHQPNRLDVQSKATDQVWVTLMYRLLRAWVSCLFNTGIVAIFCHFKNSVPCFGAH